MKPKLPIHVLFCFSFFPRTIHRDALKNVFSFMVKQDKLIYKTI